MPSKFKGQISVHNSSKNSTFIEVSKHKPNAKRQESRVTHIPLILQLDLDTNSYGRGSKEANFNKQEYKILILNSSYTLHKPLLRKKKQQITSRLIIRIKLENARKGTEK